MDAGLGLDGPNLADFFRLRLFHFRIALSGTKIPKNILNHPHHRRRLILAAQLRRPPRSISLPPGWWSPLLFLTVLAVYVHTLNPSLFRNDSPETITACITLGVSHPPGYPLYSLLGHILAMVVPVGNPAMTLNFFSALLGALGACLLAANLWLMLGEAAQPYRIATALAGALAFAFSKSYWSASLAAKGGIYVLQVDLELAFFYFLQLHFFEPSAGTKSEGGPRRPLAWLVFLFTIGLTNHWPTQLLTLPALGTLALVKACPGIRMPRKPTAKSLIQTSVFALLVLSLYLYLPLRANQAPTLNFGMPSNWHRFLDCLFRMDYSKIETMASATPQEFSALGAKALYLSDHFLNEFNSLFLLLAVLGLWGLLKKGRERLVLFLLTLLLTTLVVNVFYLRVIPIEFWHLDDHTLSLNWVLGILGGCGAGESLERLGKLRFFKNRIVLRTAACLLVVAFFPVLLFLKHRDVDDQSREFLYWGYGMTGLESMDKNARYFAETDYDYFSILYLQKVEHHRPDVGLKMTTFLAKDDWKHLAREVSSGLSPVGHPIYCAFPNGDFINSYLKNAKAASFRPAGTITEFMPSEALKNKGPAFQQQLEEFWERHLKPEQRSSNPIDGLLLELCAHPYLNTANYLKFRGDLRAWDDFYEKSLSLIQEPKWSAETSVNKAEGDLLLNNKTAVLIDYIYAFEQYKKAGLPIQAEETWQKVQAMRPSTPTKIRQK